jgi:hypothetical protein
MMASTKRFCAVLAVVAALLVPCVAMADLYSDNAVISDNMDSAAGFSGELVGATLGGGTLNFATGTNTGQRAKYAQADLAGLIGADGATIALDMVFGDSPMARNAPGWIFNVGTDGGTVAARIQSDGASFRALAPGGGTFFGGGNLNDTDSYRIAYTIRAVGGGNFESQTYINGSSAGTSGTYASPGEATTDMWMGASNSSFEWRLSGASIDNFQVFNVGMSDSQVAGIPAVAPGIIPEPTSLLLCCGLAAALAAVRRRR